MSVADDCMATCGTINLDYRSLYHHFENGCFMADCQAVVEIKNDLIRTMGECRDVTDQYSETTFQKIVDFERSVLLCLIADTGNLHG